MGNSIAFVLPGSESTKIDSTIQAPKALPRTTEPTPPILTQGIGEVARRERKRERRAWRRTNGLCVYCYQPVVEGHTVCERHQKTRRAQARKTEKTHTGRTGRPWKRHKIEAADYYLMLAEQNGRCAICRRELVVGTFTLTAPRKNRPVIDHNHTTGEIRGVLCYPCNSGIGLLQDSASVLRSAADYLDRERSLKAA